MNNLCQSSIAVFLTAISFPIYWLVTTLPNDSQPTLTLLLLVVSLGAAIACCVPINQNKNSPAVDWFHPKLLFLGFYLLYFLLPATWIWWGREYDMIWVGYIGTPGKTINTMLVIGTISVASFALGFKIPVSYPKKDVLRSLLDRSTSVHRNSAIAVILVFGTMGLGAKIYYMSLMGSFEIGILEYLSPTARRDLGIQMSQVFVLAGSMLSWAALLFYFLYTIRKAQNRLISRAWFGIGFLLFAAAVSYILSGKRSDVLPLILFPVIWSHYLINRLSASRVGVYLPIALVVIVSLLLFRIVAPLLVHGENPFNYIGQNVTEQLAFYADSGELATFEMATAALVHRQELLQELGGPTIGFLTYTFNTFVVFVPRVLWPGKPHYEDIGHVFFQTVTGIQQEVGFSVTVWGASLVFFHLPGLIIGMCLVGWIFRQVYRTLRPWEARPLNVFLYSIFFWMAFQFLRFGTLGFTFVYFVQAMLVGVVGIFLILRGNSKVPSI